MLQQTQVESVRTYYSRWIEAFPTLSDLAGSSEQRVLKLWEGLGYYSRARNLHRTAQIILKEHGGRIPDTYQELTALPGIGPYTAAAVLSIAYDREIGVVDGNVLRVVSRLSADDRDSTAPSFKRRTQRLIESSFHGFHPGWVNQAWMELGALICKPQPSCSDCPLQQSCRAYRLNRVRDFPYKPPRPKVPVRTGIILAIVRDRAEIMVSRPESGLLPDPALKGVQQSPPQASQQPLRGPLLLVRRPSKGLLGGLWELPNVYTADIDGFLENYGITIIQRFEGEVRHRYTHFEVRFTLAAAFLDQGIRLREWVEQRWVALKELTDYPRPKVHIKAMRHLGLL